MREPRRITNIEISEGNKKVRLILAIALLIIGAVALTAGIMSLLNKDTGWQKVEVSTSEKNCSSSFQFQYQFSGSGANATALHKQISAVYTEAAVKAYWLFSPDETSDTYNNIRYLNEHPNEEVEVDPVLYDAFVKLQDTRYLYLGPVYAHYDTIFFSTGEEYVPELDPAVDADSKAYLAQIAAFAAEEQAVNLELLGDNRVKLTVSQAYLDFAADHEIDRFVDFHYMANAFIIDYLAETLIQAGFTQGYLGSADGYTRNLDDGGVYNYNLFDRVGDLVYPAGVMEYRGPVSMVFLKDYPTSDSDWYYRVSGEHFVHAHASITDGMYRASVPNLVSYSYDRGCADVLLEMLPVFIGETFEVPEDVYSIWCEDRIIYYNDPEIAVKNLLQDSQVSYRAVFAE